MSTAEPPDDSGPSLPPVDAPPGSAIPPVGVPPTDATPTDATPPVDATPTDATPTAPPPGPTWSAATTGTVAPTAPAPDTWVPPAPPPKRKLTWLWILLGVLVLIAALVVVAVVLFIRTLAGPIDSTNAVLAQIKAENYAAAYRISCSADRELYTLEQYEQVFVNTTDAKGALVSYDVNYSSVSGSDADVRYDVEFARGSSDRLEAEAHKENGTWRTCLFPKRE